MLVLGIDTSTSVCSVGLTVQDQVVGEYTQNIKRTHSQRLLPLISQVLTDTGFHQRDLAGIAVSSGPGSFTGIRIGMATAKGLAQALEIPVAGVPTLDVAAAQYIHTDYLVCPLLDARRHQVYTAFYKNCDHEPRRLSEYMALSLESVADILNNFPEKGFLFPGDALPKYQDYLKERLKERFLPLPQPYTMNRGALVAYLGYKRFKGAPNHSDLYNLSPLYVRRPEAEVRWEEKQQEGGLPDAADEGTP